MSRRAIEPMGACAFDIDEMPPAGMVDQAEVRARLAGFLHEFRDLVDGLPEATGMSPTVQAELAAIGAEMAAKAEQIVDRFMTQAERGRPQ